MRYFGCESEGLEAFFTDNYRRVVLENVGHFPHREAPGLVADAVIHPFQQSIKPHSQVLALQDFRGHWVVCKLNLETEIPHEFSKHFT